MNEERCIASTSRNAESDLPHADYPERRMRHPIDMTTKPLTTPKSTDLFVLAALKRSCANIERSKDRLWFTRFLSGFPRLKVIRGASGQDPIDAVNAVIRGVARCLKCVGVETGLADSEIHNAMRVLLRAAVVRAAHSCASCGSASSAFEAPIRVSSS